MFENGHVKCIVSIEGAATAVPRCAARSACLRKIRQSATGLMQEASGILGRGGHAELAHVNGVDGRQVDAAALTDPAQERAALLGSESLARQQAAQQRVGTARINFGHQVDQQPRLRGVVRRILIDAEKAHQSVDQIVESGAEIGRAMITASPAVKAEPVVFVFFQRRGVEDAKDIFADGNGLDLVVGFSAQRASRGRRRFAGW